MTYLTQLTQSEWAPITEYIRWCVSGSNICIDFFSQAATKRDLEKIMIELISSNNVSLHLFTLCGSLNS